MAIELTKSIRMLLVTPILLLALILPYAYAVRGESFNIAISIRGATLVDDLRQTVSLTLYGQGLLLPGSKLIKFFIATGELRIGSRVLQIKGGPGAVSLNSGFITASADTQPDSSGRIYTVTVSGILHFRMFLSDGIKSFDLNVQNARISDKDKMIAGCPSGCYQGQFVQYIFGPAGSVTIQSSAQPA